MKTTKYDTSTQEQRRLNWVAATYYYMAMLLSLAVFFGGFNLATHGYLRATSPEISPIATCLPPPAPKVIDPAHLSEAEKSCRQEEHKLQIRQGSFQITQGLTMVIVACVVFSWHFKRVRHLELKLQ